jgi:hypothetical protein
MNQTFQVANAPIYKAEKRVRNDLYKRLQCVAWNATREIDPMRTGPQALGAQACDVAIFRGASATGDLKPTQRPSTHVPSWISQPCSGFQSPLGTETKEIP